MVSNPIISLIIPAYNEEVLLPRLLQTVSIAKSQYHKGSDAVEVIVVDNDSSDATAKLARSHDCKVINEEKRIIAAVRNAGAKVAKGEILAFIDADSQVHPQTFNAIEKSIASGNVIGGATGVKLERLSVGLSLTFMLMYPMILLTGMDTGVVFCKRDDFRILGGYNENLLFAEDVRFLLDLKRLGRGQGKKLGRVTDAKAIASCRKFDKYGDWHYFPLIFRFIYSFFLFSGTMDKFAQEYWYDDRD
ncbi:glycosyltransferase [Candidatus Riflebacteria bacterium]